MTHRAPNSHFAGTGARIRKKCDLHPKRVTRHRVSPFVSALLVFCAIPARARDATVGVLCCDHGVTKGRLTRGFSVCTGFVISGSVGTCWNLHGPEINSNSPTSSEQICQAVRTKG